MLQMKKTLYQVAEMHVLAFETRLLSWIGSCYYHFMQFTCFHLAGFVLKRSSMNQDLSGVAPESVPTPWGLCPNLARLNGQFEAVENHLAKTRGPIEFRRTAHCQIVTAEHVLAQAWTINAKHEKLALVYKEWVYPWEVERVDCEIFEPLRKSGELHAFSFAYHQIDFRWDRAKDKSR